MEPWDIFISHASEDKECFVHPLAQRLQELAVRVWYDRFVLVPGDRLSEKIAEGLARSRCGLLVLSKSFIGKPWTRYEMSGLVNRFVEEGTRLIPLWLGVSREDVASLNPALADLFSISASSDNIEECAFEILRVVRPQLHENLSLLAAIGSSKVKVGTKPAGDLKGGPIRHHDLPSSFLVRIQNVWFATRDVFRISLEKTIENFQRDLRPERELEIMERIVGALQIAMDSLDSDDQVMRQEVFKVLVSFSLGAHERVFNDTNEGKIDEAVTTVAAQAWLKVIPPVTVSDVEANGEYRDRDGHR